MKQEIQTLLTRASQKLQDDGILPATDLSIQVERTRDISFGDFASNIALMLAKPTKKSPKELAQLIIDKLPASPLIRKVEIAGPGFINFTMTDSAYHAVIKEILENEQFFGRLNLGHGQRIHLEYVSANPTGPLHVGHGRGAAYGACLANLFKAVGYQVHQEYYVNDAGRQMQILTLSVWLHYLQLLGEFIELPKNTYQGSYIIEVAKNMKEQYGTQFHHKKNKILSLLPDNLNHETDPDAYADSLIKIAHQLLNDKNFSIIRQKVLENVLADIKDDLGEFGVNFDKWFYESDLAKMNLVNEGIQLLKQHGYTYEREGTLWFRATSLGDEKDRVLIRKNKQPTYFASDVAYHLYKYNQDYNYIIDIFGADHHGFIARLRAFLKGLGKDPDKLKILLVQFAILYRGKEKVPMSKRSGKYITLRELRYEVGNDATRYFYIMRKPEQHLDFDLELAKSKSSENPVYYIQYAHARICSVWRQLANFEWVWDKEQGLQHLSQLTESYEKNLLNHLSRYPEVIERAAIDYEPHLLANYLQELANFFHTYYNAIKFLVENSILRDARLCLIKATQQVVANGLRILGLSTPEVM